MIVKRQSRSILVTAGLLIVLAGCGGNTSPAPGAQGGGGAQGTAYPAPVTGVPEAYPAGSPYPSPDASTGQAQPSGYPAPSPAQ